MIKVMRTFAVVGLAGGLSLAIGAVGTSASNKTQTCFGTVKVAPQRLAAGQSLTFTGKGFTCTEPSGARFPQATLVLFQPKGGFALVTVHPKPNGTYVQKATMPKQLLPISRILTGGGKKISTPPGTYWVTMTLVDVHTVPVSEAMAHFTVIK